MTKEIDIKAFIEGDQKEFKRIVGMYNLELTYYVYKLIENVEETKDIVQETFVALFVNRKGFETAAPINSYLYTTAKHKSLNYLKSNKTRSGHKEKIRYQSDDSEEAQVLRAWILTDDIKELYENIKKLPPARQKVVVLLLEGKKHADIAGILNIAVSNVSSHIHNALASLRKLMEKKGEIF